jgi:CheY-like chemotaxis protein
MMQARTIREQGRHAEVLLVEDDPDHVDLIRMAVEDAGLPMKLHVAGDGEQALSFLRREPPYAAAPRPDFILLDLNMPRMDGYTVMRRIGEDPQLRGLVVIVLTTSADPADVRRMMELRCNSYLVKPVGFDELAEQLSRLADYWIGLAVLQGSPQPHPG